MYFLTDCCHLESTNHSHILAAIFAFSMKKRLLPLLFMEYLGRAVKDFYCRQVCISKPFKLGSPWLKPCVSRASPSEKLTQAEISVLSNWKRNGDHLSILSGFGIVGRKQTAEQLTI